MAGHDYAALPLLLHYPRQEALPGDVQNKQAALAAIDRALGHDGPPAVEYIVVEETQGGIPGAPQVPVGFGHAVLRYRLPDGQQRIANITKLGHLVEFFEDPADYLFGLGGGKHGAFARQLYSIRIQHWSADAILAMHHYLCAINASSDAAASAGRRAPAQFDLTGAFTGWTGWLTGARMAAAGNCSNWTSRAMHLAGLLDRPHTLPKAVFIDLFEEFVLRVPAGEPPRAQVVIYRQAAAGKLSPTAADPSQRCCPRRFDAPVHGMTSPLHPLRQLLFWDVAPYADAVVSIDDGAVLRSVREGGGLRLVEGAPEGGVGLLKVDGDGEGQVEASRRLRAAMTGIAARVEAVPAPRRLGWYRHALRWRVHRGAVVLSLGLYAVWGYPRESSPLAAGLARASLCVFALIVHAATS